MEPLRVTMDLWVLILVGVCVLITASLVAVRSGYASGRDAVVTSERQRREDVERAAKQMAARLTQQAGRSSEPNFLDEEEEP